MAEKNEKNEEEKEITLEDLIRELENMDERGVEDHKLVDVEMPETLGLQKKENIEIDEEALLEEVSNLTKGEYDIKKNKTLGDYEDDREVLESQREIESQSSERKKASVEEAYDRARIATENDTLKRGLARSSIAVFGLANIEDGRAKQLAGEASALEEALSKIERDLVSLERKRDLSLDNLEISLANDIERRMAEKLSALREAQEKVLEYNNKIQQMESEYQADRSKQLSDQKKAQYEFESKYGGEIAKKLAQQKFDIALKFLNKLTRTEAIKTLISTPELARVLGDSYYDLYYVQSRRKA